MSDAIFKILAAYDEQDRSNVWQVQSSWVIKHACLERVAAKAGVKWLPPTILRAEKDEAVILVRATLGEREEWSIGEALVNTNYKVSGKQAAYVYAMAEKRGKDRVVLKLVGLHGLAYSEDEADDFKEPAPQAKAEPERSSSSSVGDEDRAPRLADPERENDIIAFLSGAQTALQLADTNEDVDGWLLKNKPEMKRLGIVEGSPAYPKLKNIVTSRRAELAGGNLLMAG